VSGGQLAKSSWQKAVGKKQLAKSSWQKAVGKKSAALGTILLYELPSVMSSVVRRSFF
jgi:hypothetical protein